MHLTSRPSIVLAVASSAMFAQAPSPAGPPGQAVFDRQCATCHAEATSGAPTRDALRQLSPEAILNALTNGKMQVHGATMSDGDRRTVAEFLGGRALAATPTVSTASRCTTSTPVSDPTKGPAWNGWGNDPANTRYQPKETGRLTAADLPKLKLKWAFGYAGVSSARSQPTVAGGRLFVASENAEVHALDPKTGCTYWTYKAASGIRSAMTVGEYKTGGASGYALYFGDTKANVYAVDANTVSASGASRPMIIQPRPSPAHQRCTAARSSFQSRDSVKKGAAVAASTNAALSVAACLRTTPTPASGSRECPRNVIVHGTTRLR